MENGKTLIRADTSSEWLDKAKILLDSYLREFGISAEVTRAHWVNRVVDALVIRAEHLAEEDILEEAIEHMRDLIETRVAMVCHYDPVREHKEIAQVLVVLLNEKYADCLNMLFECGQLDALDEAEKDSAMLLRLRRAIASSLPIPVPVEAPLVMPLQAIELRSINPLRRLFQRHA